MKTVLFISLLALVSMRAFSGSTKVDSLKQLEKTLGLTFQIEGVTHKSKEQAQHKPHVMT